MIFEGLNIKILIDNKIIYRVISAFLVMMMTISAPATVLADADINTADISIEDDITESGETDSSFSESGIIFDENIPDDFDSDEHDTVSDDSIDAVSSNIVHEVIAERTENERTYVNPDHSVTKVVYTDTVHYDHDGQWLPIDNSLSYHTGDKNEYRNAANSFSVSFSEYSDDDSLLVFRDGRSKAVFSYVSQNSLAEDSNQGDDNTGNEKTESYHSEETEPHHSKIQIINNGGNKKREVSENEVTGASYGDDSDSEESGESGDYSAFYTLPKTESEVMYEEIEKDVDLYYTLRSDYLKEEIILKAPGTPDRFTFRI